MAKKTVGPTDRHVGARIRMQRMVCGMSQTDLDESVGVTFQQVQKYENGTNRVSASRLQQIANVLKVAPDFLFQGRVDKSCQWPQGGNRHRGLYLVAGWCCSVLGVHQDQQRQYATQYCLVG